VRSALLLALGVLASTPAAAGTVYAASQGGGTLTRIAPGDAAAVAIGPGPAQIAAGPEGRLYLTHSDQRAITVVDGRANAILRRLPFPGQPFGIVVSADGAGLYVGDWSGGRVLRLSAETGAVEAAVAVGRDPAGLVLDRRGRLYVADRESRQVSVVETGSMTRVATIPVGEGPFALALSPAQDRLYVANVRSGDLSVIDTAGLRVSATAAIGGMPYGVAVSAEGSRVVVTNQQAGSVTILDSGDLAPRAIVPVGRYPEGVVVDDGRAYVANWFSDDVSVVDLREGREIARLPVGEGPRSLAVVPDRDAEARP
jgi:YVTN family beta-propeller protein